MTPSITPVELNSLMSTGCCLVDVREPVEHAEEHISGSQLIPLAGIGQHSPPLDPNVPLVVMCRSGKRGAQALEKLRALGFTGARNLEGGILAWKAAGLPVAKGAGKVLPLMQQVQIVIGTGVLIGVLLSLLMHPYWMVLSAFFGAGLVFAGTTGWCGLAILLSKMPWNRGSGANPCASRSCAAGN